MECRPGSPRRGKGDVEFSSYHLIITACVLWFVGGCYFLARRLVRKRAKVTEEQRVEAAKHKRIMEALVETEGWKMLYALAEREALVRTNQVLLKPTEIPLEQEYM